MTETQEITIAEAAALMEQEYKHVAYDVMNVEINEEEVLLAHVNSLPPKGLPSVYCGYSVHAAIRVLDHVTGQEREVETAVRE